MQRLEVQVPVGDDAVDPQRDQPLEILQVVDRPGVDLQPELVGVAHQLLVDAVEVGQHDFGPDLEAAAAASCPCRKASCRGYPVLTRGTHCLKRSEEIASNEVTSVSASRLIDVEQLADGSSARLLDLEVESAPAGELLEQVLGAAASRLVLPELLVVSYG